MLALLAEGSFTATYKYALMLALIDLCVEGTAEGVAPTSVTIAQVADRLIELYWPHTTTYTHWPTTDHPSDDKRLYQLRGRAQAGVVRLIAGFRQRLPRPCLTARVAQRLDPDGYESLRAEVAWIAATQPIPRLQLIGRRHEPFLYRIGWTIEQNTGEPIEPDLPLLSRRAQLGRAEHDNRLVFVEGAPDRLVALAAVLRPLIQRQWSDMVARLNHLPERHLEDFLFGAERVELSPVRAPLWDLQGGRCFYCDQKVSLGAAHVDHVLPWSRVPLDDLGNLVVADARCNLSKRDLLVDGRLIARWMSRETRRIAEIAERLVWEHTPWRPQTAARVVYGHLDPSAPVWRSRDELSGLNPGERETILELLRAPAS